MDSILVFDSKDQKFDFALDLAAFFPLTEMKVFIIIIFFYYYFQNSKFS